MNPLKIGMSGAVGTFMLMVGELLTKGQYSTIFTIRNLLAEFFGVGNLTPIAIGTMIVFIGIGTATCFIFEVKTLKEAFYRGSSVLAIIMSLTPSQDYMPLKTIPHSVLVNIDIQTADKKQLSEAYVTVWDLKTNTIFGKSKFIGNKFSFYQPGGRYRIDIQAKGYYISSVEFEVREGDQPKTLTIEMRISDIPILIQQILR